MNYFLKPSGFSGKSFKMGEGLAKAQNGVALHTANTSQWPDPHASDGLDLTGFKRKRDSISRSGYPRYASSLVLGLGSTPSCSDTTKSSSCTMFSVKEPEEERSADLGLGFQLHLGNRISCSSKQEPLGAQKALEHGPCCDLQLSLSLGHHSAITSASPDSAQHQNGGETSVTVGTPSLVDDGSTSSCWEPEGSSLPPFTFVEGEATSVKTNPEKTESQLLSPSVLMPRTPVTCSSGLALQRITHTKPCSFQGCRKGARGASGLCIAHGGGRRCQREGCNKGAEGRTAYCKAHGGGRRCQFLGCTKSAEGRTDYCISHGGGRRCSREGCTKAARGKSGLCIRHGGGKRCQKENCTKSAEGHSGLCISHGGGRRCQFPGCSKGAQGSTIFCKAHGGGKRCSVLGCTKGAEGSTPYCKGHGGGKRCAFQGGNVCPKSVHGGTQFCVAHGGGKRCAISGCTKSARGRTDFCVRHGGGKRCRSEGCGKSAQGRTDFCKAHGGGKRCLWGQAGSNVGVGAPPCDRFARGKTSLCAAHGALIQDRCVHGGGTLGLANAATHHRIKASSSEEGDDGSTCTRFLHPRPHSVTLPEGRVHGGILMAMLAGSADADAQSGGGNGPSEKIISEYAIPRKWM
ncbi:unnamed protein product [Spirodela intermedia]|uniref:WRKY19-like zinc finger domain-containing protein n=1 Tax=Spirodela intermedia TaxID=51605 RepID=A0A7I8KZD5_SPIIN|nr:unnamed protein product [Spirodela intermedia]